MVSVTSRRRVSWWDWTSVGALVAFCALSFLYFGLRLLTERGRQYIGPHDDPQISIWSFGWLLHAVLHGHNPLITHDVWAPTGVNLTWATTVPGIAFLFSPLTLIAGPFLSYNAAAALLPGVGAWTAFLLCRHLTRSLWPALAGGYLFGFSSYVLVQQHSGHLQLATVFLIPLAALIVLRYLQDELDGRGLAIRLGPLLACELLISTEIAFSLSLALLGAVLVAFLLVPGARARIRSLLGPLVAAFVLAAALASPYLYYAFTGFRISSLSSPGQYPADLLNLVVPTGITLSAWHWAHHIASHFAATPAESGAYVGLPLLAIVAWFGWAHRHASAGRFLLGALALTTFFSFGSELTVDGRRVVPLPTPFGRNVVTLPYLGPKHVPLLDDILPVRLTLYSSLAIAVMVAIWMAARPAGSLARVLLPAVAVVAITPNLAASGWATTFRIPPFFTSSAYRSCLAPNEVVLPEPVGSGGDSMLWQVADDFRFRMAGGRLQTSPPTQFLHPQTIAVISVGYPPAPGQTRLFRAYFKAKGVTGVIVERSSRAVWSPALDPIAKPTDVGGVVLYRLTGSARCV